MFRTSERVCWPSPRQLMPTYLHHPMNVMVERNATHALQIGYRTRAVAVPAIVRMVTVGGDKGPPNPRRSCAFPSRDGYAGVEIYFLDIGYYFVSNTGEFAIRTRTVA